MIKRTGNQIFAQYLPLEEINTHRRQCALRLTRLLLKFIDPQLIIGVQNTEATSLLNRDINDRDSAVCIFSR